MEASVRGRDTLVGPSRRRSLSQILSYALLDIHMQLVSRLGDRGATVFISYDVLSDQIWNDSAYDLTCTP